MTVQVYTDSRDQHIVYTWVEVFRILCASIALRSNAHAIPQRHCVERYRVVRYDRQSTQLSRMTHERINIVDTGLPSICIHRILEAVFSSQNTNIITRENNLIFHDYAVNSDASHLIILLQFDSAGFDLSQKLFSGKDCERPFAIKHKQTTKLLEGTKSGK